MVLIGTTQAVVNIIENDINAAGNVFIASGSSNLLDGVAGNNNSYESSVSADGRYVTFSSDARNLVDNDFNFNTDVFVRDLITQSTRLVSVNQFGGVSGNDSSYSAQISGDGRYVLFASSAADLAADDANSALDVFQRDLFLETTTLISRHFTGTNSANNSSYTADQNRSLMSSNGQVAVFTSYADDLVNAPDSNFDNDVFLYDASTGTNRLISINAAGTDAGASYSIDPVVSADGQIVAFTSYASDLVADDFNDTEDVFIRDVAAGTTELVSINLIGSGSANAQSGMAFLSADGRFVAFESSATDLATNDVTFAQDVYWRDRQSGTTVLVSVNTNGAAAGNNTSTVNGISADGRYVVFSSYANNLVTNDSNFSQDVFVRDMWSNTTVLVSVNLAGNASANSDSFNAVISGDGTGVSFESYATDLTAQTKFGFNTDVFVRDLVTGTTRLVSYRNGSTNAPDASSYDPAINFNGDVTSFTGDPESGGGGGEGLAIVVNGGQYMDVWAHTWPSNTTELVSVSSPSASGSSYSYGAVVSRDGQWAAFVSNASNLATNDLNNTEDVYLINLNTFAIRLLSTNLSGVAANDYSSNPSISSNGNYIAFDSVASDLTANDGNFNQDVFVHDRLTGSNILVSVNLTGTDTGNGYSAFPSISPDGRYVAFESDANNLTTNGTSFNRDIFLRDLQTGNTRLISHNVAGNSGGDASSFGAGIEVDPVSGKIYVVYTSYAGNLVNNDTNLTQDVFLYDVAAGSNHLVSVNSSGTGSGNGFSYNPRLAVNSASSNVFVTFISTAGNLVNNDTNGFEDVFLFDLKSKTNRLVSVNQSGTISGNGYSILPSISADGRYVAFQSFATDLVTGDTNSIEDIFLRDTVSGSTTLITKTCDGTSSADGFSHDAVVSADGRYITYLSAAMNHVPGNFFGTDNVFRYDRVLDTSVLISQNRFLTGGANGPSYNPQISGDGSVILFSSLATDLVADDANSEEDVFIWKAGTVATAVDLVMNKSASSPTVGEYFNFTYTLAVTNFGTLAASGVSVTDTLPAGVSFVSAVTTQGTVTNSGNTVTASVGNLGVTAGAQITITVTATNAGVVNNIASTTAVESDATPGNNSDNAVVTITPLTPPTLTITPTNASQLLITWPSSTPNVFVAQTTTNLIPVIVWSNLTNAITDNGSVKFILLNVNIGEPERYYRLKK